MSDEADSNNQAELPPVPDNMSAILAATGAFLAFLMHHRCEQQIPEMRDSNSWMSLGDELLDDLAGQPAILRELARRSRKLALDKVPTTVRQ